MYVFSLPFLLRGADADVRAESSDPNAPVERHPTSITISQDRGDKEFEFSGDEGVNVGKGGGGGGGQMFTETGRPRRSRQAMTRG